MHRKAEISNITVVPIKLPVLNRKQTNQGMKGIEPLQPSVQYGAAAVSREGKYLVYFLIAMCGVAAGGRRRRRNLGFGWPLVVCSPVWMQLPLACAGGVERRALEMWKALTNHISQERFMGVRSIAEGMDVRFSYTMRVFCFRAPSWQQPPCHCWQFPVHPSQSGGAGAGE